MLLAFCIASSCCSTLSWGAVASVWGHNPRQCLWHKSVLTMYEAMCTCTCCLCAVCLVMLLYCAASLRSCMSSWKQTRHWGPTCNGSSCSPCMGPSWKGWHVYPSSYLVSICFISLHQYLILQGTVWGVEQVVAHQTCWLESTVSRVMVA